MGDEDPQHINGGISIEVAGFGVASFFYKDLAPLALPLSHSPVAERRSLSEASP